MAVLSKLARASSTALILLLASENLLLAEPSLGDKTAAETLFLEGRKQLTVGRFADACKSFSDSQRLDPGVGTLLNLATCYEKLGKTASAWTTYREAASAAHVASQPAREKSARQSAEALEPRLAKITIVVKAADRAPDMQIARDGEVVPVTLWGVAMAIDPGSHQFEASARGRANWRTQIVAEGGKSIPVAVPPLESDNRAVAQRVPASTPVSAAQKTNDATPVRSPSHFVEGSQSNGTSTQRIVGGVVAGAGLVAAAVGGYFGVRALTAFRDAECTRPANQCTPGGLEAQRNGLSDGRISTAAISGGLVAIAAGVVLWATAPSRTASDAAISPSGMNPRFWVSALPIGETRTVMLSGAF